MSTQGVWFNLLMAMWDAPEQGKIRGTKEAICRIIGAKEKELDLFLLENVGANFATVTMRNGKVTIRNRRMYDDYLERKSNAERQKRHREKSQVVRNRQSNAKVTPSSSSSSSTSKKKKYLTFVFLTDTEHDKLVKRFGSDGARAKIKALDDGIAIHGYKYKNHYRVILKWAEDDKPSAAVIADKKCSRSFCKESAVYGGVDDTGQKYYLCEIHKPKRK